MKLLTLLGLVATAAVVSLAAPVDDSTTATNIAPRNNFYGFDFRFTEYCKDGTNNGKATFTAWDFTIDFEIPKEPAGMALTIDDTGSLYELQLAFDAPNSWVNFDYGKCHWGMGEFTMCGLCITRENWSSDSLNCGGGSTASRTFRSYCNIDLNAQLGPHANAITARQTAPEVSRNAIASGQADVQAADKPLVIQSPKVIQTPTDHEGVYKMTLPFQLQIIEYCQGNAIKAIATYRNGNVGVWNMPLSPTGIHYVDHLVSGFTSFGVGPYNFKKSEVAFVYACDEYRCEWNENEADKECGECRAGAWSRSPLSCGGFVGDILRVKDLECSFVLGYSIPQEWGTPQHRLDKTYRHPPRMSRQSVSVAFVLEGDSI